jgi:hypothetical protein
LKPAWLDSKKVKKNQDYVGISDVALKTFAFSACEAVDIASASRT